jgi:demethylmenaquinone methyltransferase/2-methoxy-6-polyprenyl-1,4-benzoquinol methylase
MQSTLNFFNQAARTWDIHCLCRHDAIERIIKLLNIRQGQRVLDVGSGTGVLLPFLLPAVGASGEVTALDLSPEMLTMARRKFGNSHNVRFKLFDIEQGSLAQRYDCIVLFNMYPHLRAPYDSVVNLARHNLKTGGTLTIAHYPGREHINKIHRQKTCDVYSDALNPIGQLAEDYSNRGLSVIYAEDTTDFYLLQLRELCGN